MADRSAEAADQRLPPKALAVVLDRLLATTSDLKAITLRSSAPTFRCLPHPLGGAADFDGPHSDEVRRFFIENALYWITEFHIDALRLERVHAIIDFSARPFLEELAQAFT